MAFGKSKNLGTRVSSGVEALGEEVLPASSGRGKNKEKKDVRRKDKVKETTRRQRHQCTR